MAFCFFESGVFRPRIFSAEAARKRNISEIAQPRICDFQVLFLAWRFEVERTKSKQ